MMNRLRACFGETISTANLSDRIAAVYGDRTAVHLDAPLDYRACPARSLTYRELHNLVEKFSAVLAGNGVRPGERVAIAISNQFDLFLLWLAVMRIGAVAVPINHLLAGVETVDILARCGARTLILDAAVHEKTFKSRRPPTNVKRILVAGKAIDALTGSVTIDDALLGPLEIPPAVQGGASDVATILFTSGTTGEPQGVLLTSQGLVARMQLAFLYPASPHALVLVPLPLSHVMGLVAVLLPLLAGMPLYFLPEFSAARVLEILADKRCTMFVGVPAMYRMMLKAGLDRHDLSSVRVWVSAADRFPAEVIREFKSRGAFLRLGSRRTDALFVDAYGSVELGGAALVRVSLPGTSRFDEGFLGVPLPHCRTCIRREDGSVARLGETGELWVRCPSGMTGYADNEAATSEARVDGWIRTGDLASRSRLGFVRLVDRKKSVIKCGGYSIFPAEIERALLAHDAVDAAAAFGTPHPTLQEAAIAFVSLKPGSRISSDDLRTFARTRLARHKMPERILIVAPEALAVGPTSKVRRIDLPGRLAALQGERQP